MARNLESRVYEGADIIDSRDVIARIDELESAGTLGEDDSEELTKLRNLASEGESYAADWRHGEALISDDHFTAYAEELADDIGAIDKNASWPINHIDWNAAAEALKQDYSSIEYGSTTYWVRS